MMTTVVVGIGMSSRATVGEVQDLIDEVLRAASLTRADIAAVATRQCFSDDARLPAGIAVDLVPDADLVAASPPPDRTVGIPAQVAVTAATLATQRRWGSAQVVVPPRRSRHATAAICMAVPS